jgi:hypothetical protein
MSIRRNIWGGGVVAAALSLILAACGSDSLVGGTCRTGLLECSLKCVDVQADPANCGACGHVCSSSQTCIAGSCGIEGGAPDADEEVDASIDSEPADVAADVTAVEATLPDGVPPGDADLSDAGPSCPAPYNTPEHCGTCETQCAAGNFCGLSMGEYQCIPQCELPLEACGPLCIDRYSDENNCNGCGNVCPSGICQAGECVGSGFGHQIVIGMDYTDDNLSQTSAQVTLLANAVMVPVRSMVRVLVYDEFVDPALKDRLQTWIGNQAVAKGRGVSFESAGTWTGVPPRLAVANYDTFLILDQALAPTTITANAGTLWNGAMDAFAKGGGVVVALDGNSPAQMVDLINNGGLFTILDEADVETNQLRVDAPGDVVGLNVTNIFVARARSVSFVTKQKQDNRHVFVVSDKNSGLPVVVHSIPVTPQ